jgi:hypothetical protein
MRTVRVFAGEEEIEPLLGFRERCGDIEAEAAQPRRSDRDQERLDSLGAAAQIGEPLLYEVGAGEIRALPRRPARHAETLAERASRRNPQDLRQPITTRSGRGGAARAATMEAVEMRAAKDLTTQIAGRLVARSTTSGRNGWTNWFRTSKFPTG